MESKSSATDAPVAQIVAKVVASSRYHTISEDLIRRIAAQELEKRPNPREAIKATKNKLHQVGGAYLDHPLDYQVCLNELKIALSTGKDAFLQVCQRVMCYHSSTRERLPEIDRFFRTILADLPPIRSVLDIACGLNPFAIPWMGLPEGVEYYAVDIYRDMIDFINQYMAQAGVHGTAVVADVIGNCPSQPVDIAFLLKTIPCLEQVDKTAGTQIIHRLQASHVIVSFPVNSLGGRHDKGMLVNYANRFKDIVANHDWVVKRYEFKTELVFVVSK